jgi:imidazolonepropionase-like amidohydrolase
LLASSLAAPLVAAEQSLVFDAARVYIAPDAPPLDNAVIMVRGDKIAAVSAREQSSTPTSTLPSECQDGIVLAGFQNSHVHFIGDGFFDANAKSAVALASQLERMLTRFGYTTVVDTSSELENTLTIRRRIQSGEISGPRILTVGGGVFPPAGLPIYIAHLPSRFLDSQLLPESADAARLAVRDNLERGADATKLFVATPQADHSVKRMPLEIARAAADTTHAKNKLVMVHPTDIEGVRLALAIEADVLVHTTLGAEAPWPADVVQQLLSNEVAIAPTFKLLNYELQKQNVPEEIAKRLVAMTLEHFKPFVAGGGSVIFGTDVGYMTDYDPTEEYVLMERAGMTHLEVLASLTTEPARLWSEATRRGRVEAGMDADLVVLAADPAEDIRHFADVRCAIRAGKVIYRQQKRPASRPM